MKCLKSQTGKQLQSNFIGYCMANSEDLEIAKGDQSLLILKNTSHAAKTGLYLHTFIPAKNVQSHSLSWLKEVEVESFTQIWLPYLALCSVPSTLLNRQTALSFLR